MNKIMIKKILLLATVVFLVTGCGNLELKKSASNKLFDTRGFDGAKRKPLYNGKYIDRAKRNVVENNYEEDSYDMDEPDEFVDPYTQNRIMYSNMVRNEGSDKRSGQRRNQNIRGEPYPNIGHARDIAKAENKDDANAELRRELSEIRSILSSTKKDLAKYKCPLQDSPKQPLSNNPSAPKKPTKKPMAVKREIKQEVEEAYEEDEELSATVPHDDNKKSVTESRNNAMEQKHDAADVVSNAQENNTVAQVPVADNNASTPTPPHVPAQVPAPVVSEPLVSGATAPDPEPVAPVPSVSNAAAVAPTPVEVVAPAAAPAAVAQDPKPPEEHKMINLAPLR